MNFKRITIISGHYGSGKTNIAINLALDLRKQHSKAAIADVDIVNPYFRTKDSEQLLEQAGVKLICSEYANSNVDIPALPQAIYSVTDDTSLFSILDVGGDERGALALGRIAPKIRSEGNFDMIYVVNKYRPLTKEPASAIEVMREIEQACGLRFTAMINNSNLGLETTPKDVLDALPYAEEISRQTGIPVLFTTVHETLFEPLHKQIDNLYPLLMQKTL